MGRRRIDRFRVIYNVLWTEERQQCKVIFSQAWEMRCKQKGFLQVQGILDQNKLLINEISQNHESRIPDNLSWNAGLIRELNNNIRRVVNLNADLSSLFTQSMEASSEGESRSDGKSH